MDLKKLLSQMSLRDKAAQMTQLATKALSDDLSPEMTGPAQELGLTQADIDRCGSIFNIRSAQQRIEIQNAHMQRDPNRIPLVFMQDVIHGFRTVYPIPLAMACSFDPALVRRCSAMAAKEAAVSGVDTAFSPMVDLSRDARWGRCMEGAGEDPFLGCEMAKAQVEGYREGMDGKNMDACVKHFAAYGAGEAGREYNYADMSEAALEDRYLPPYKAALDAGAKCVMPSFNSVNGVPSIANRRLLRDILRTRWGFDGVVLSDYGAVAELIAHGAAEDEADAALLALKAGCDLEMMSSCYLHGLERLLAEKRIDMAMIDECVMRILKYKEELGLFENPNGQADPGMEECQLSSEHRGIARQAAEQSAVLLKNDGLLPLSDKIQKVAVIGPFAESGRIIGGWAVNADPADTVTIAQGVRNRLPEAQIRVCAGCGDGLLEEDLSGIEEASALAAWADAVILTLGEEGDQAGEAKSRAVLSLSKAQLALFEAVHKANPNTCVLLLTGRPLAIEEIDGHARTILCMWQPGTEGGNAAARLLFGDVSPSGALAMTFPRTTGQEPISYNEYATGRPAADRFDPKANSFKSAYIDMPNAPLYPFGFGLGYTSFALTDARLSGGTLTDDGTITASCRLKNTGNREGAAVVQLYIRDLKGSRVRPVRELKGFEKVFLKPGEEKEVFFAITEPMLRFTTLENGCSSEKGRFTAFLSLDSQSGEALPFELV